MSNNVYRQAYEIMNRTNPLTYDCGELCGSICCKCNEYDKKSYFIYMLHGEEQIHDKSDSWLEWGQQSTYEHGFPLSWGETVITVKCSGPSFCNREMRPIQCKTFPLLPHLTKEGRLNLIFYDMKLPYTCPIIAEKKMLSPEFLRNTYEAWKILISKKEIYDFVKRDSADRRKFWRKYKTAYKPDIIN